MKLPIGLYRVEGASMEPTYMSGDLLVGWRWFNPKVGDVVVVKIPQLTILKRIVGLSKKEVQIAGDNRASSTDSRHFGNIDEQQLQARIIAKIR